MLYLRLLWEIPAALLSLILFKTVRFLLRILANINASSQKKTVFSWLVYSDELLRKPLVLTSILVTGPRWNPHVIAAGFGPVNIRESLEIEIKSCLASAQSWSIGIYTFPQAKAVEYIGSDNSNLEDEWCKIKLAPGKYTFGLRYYNWSAPINLPKVNIDGINVNHTQSISIDKVNDYLENLTKRDNLFYRCLNYYIFTLLLCQKWLPQAWIKKEYLPVGDPNNEFVYGVIYKNYSLTLELKELILKYYDVYLTIYNRSSLPVIWCQIEQEKYTISRSEQDGFYLVRLRSKSNLSRDAFQLDWIKCQLLPAIN